MLTLILVFAQIPSNTLSWSVKHKFSHKSFASYRSRILQRISIHQPLHLLEENDEVFGAEFRDSDDDSPFRSNDRYSDLSTSAKENVDGKLYVNSRGQVVREKSQEEVNKIIASKQSYNILRSTFVFDSLFLSSLGLSFVWFIGTYKDAYSYALGATLGILYSILLGNYVETIGTAQRKSKIKENARFLPGIVIQTKLYKLLATTNAFLFLLISFF